MTYSEYEILFEDVNPELKEDFDDYAGTMIPLELSLFLSVVTEMVAPTPSVGDDQIQRETQLLIRHKLRCLVNKLRYM